MKLCNELKKHLKEIHGYISLYHPLVLIPMYHDDLAEMANNLFKQKKNKIEELKHQKKWFQYLLMHEKPFLLNAFLEIQKNLTDQEYWENLQYIWTYPDSPHVNLDIWCKLFLSDRKKRDHLMTTTEQVFLEKMPEKITIYRGQKEKEHLGLSYTLNKNIALWFAKRFNKTEQYEIITRTIDKKNVLAYFSGRDEEEILIHPRIL